MRGQKLLHQLHPEAKPRQSSAWIRGPRSSPCNDAGAHSRRVQRDRDPATACCQPTDSHPPSRSHTSHSLPDSERWRSLRICSSGAGEMVVRQQQLEMSLLAVRAGAPSHAALSDTLRRCGQCDQLICRRAALARPAPLWDRADSISRRGVLELLASVPRTPLDKRESVAQHAVQALPPPLPRR